MRSLYFRILLILLLLPAGLLLAQPLETHYYDHEWKPTEQDHAAYYRLIRYDSLGKPNGQVRDYYINGRLQWIGKLLEDEPEDILDSTCTWFNDQGEITEQSTYVNGLLQGPFFMVSEGGGCDSGYYAAGKKQGLWRSFDKHGTLLRQGNYIADKLEGVSETFDADGILTERSEYYNGRMHGTSRTYRDGRLSELTYYQHGLKEGACKSYSSFGLLLDSSYYKEGLISGCRVSYYEYTYPPRLKEEWSFVNGTLQQYCKYDTSGQLIHRNDYRADLLIGTYSASEKAHDHSTYAWDSSWHDPEALHYKYWRWHKNGQLKEYLESFQPDPEIDQYFMQRRDFYTEAGIAWATLTWDTTKDLYIHKDYDHCLYGLRNKRKKWVVKPVYSSIQESACGYIAFLNGKAAFLSSSGKQVLPPRFDDCLVLVNPICPMKEAKRNYGAVLNIGPFEQPGQFYLLANPDTLLYLKVRVGGRYGLYSISGRMLYDTIYQQIEFDWSHGLKLSRDGLTEYIYRDGSKVSLPFGHVQRIEHREDFFIYADKEEDYQRKVGLLHSSGKALSGLDYDGFRGYSHGWFQFVSNHDTAFICLLDSNGVERMRIEEERLQLISKPSELIIIHGRDHAYRLYDSRLKPLLENAFSKVTLQDSALVLEENGKKGFYDLASRRFFPCLYEQLHVFPGRPIMLAQDGNTLHILNRQNGFIQSIKNTRYLYADTFIFLTLQKGRVSGYATHGQNPIPPEILFPDSLNEFSTSDETFWIDHSGQLLLGGEKGRLEKAGSGLYKWSNKAGQLAWIRRNGTFVLPFGPYRQLNTENPNYYQVSTGIGRQGLLKRNGKILLDTLYAAITHPFSHGDSSYCWVVLYDKLTPGMWAREQQDPDEESYEQELTEAYVYPYEGLWQLYNISTRKLSDSVFQFPFAFSPRGYARVTGWMNEEEPVFNIIDLSGQLLFSQPVEDWIETGVRKYFKQKSRWYLYRGKNQKAEQLPYDLMKEAGFCSGGWNVYVEKNGWANLLDEQGQEILSGGQERISRLMVFKDYSCSLSAREIFDEDPGFTLFRSLPLHTRLYIDSLVFKELEQENHMITADRAWVETDPVFGMQEAQEEVNRWVWSQEERTELRFNLEQTAAQAYALWVQVENSSTASRGPGQYESYTYYRSFYQYRGRLYKASLPRLFKVNDAFKTFIFRQAHQHMDEYAIPEEECSTPQQFYNKVKDNFTIGKNGITFFLNNLMEPDANNDERKYSFTVSYALLNPWILSAPLLTAIGSK